MIVKPQKIGHGKKKSMLILGTTLLLGRCDVGLSAYARWVLLRFICVFGEEQSRDALAQLAEQIGVQHKKLRTVLSELEQCGVVSVTFPEQGQRARVRHVQLNLAYFESLIGSGKNFYEYVEKVIVLRLPKQIPLRHFIFRIINHSADIIISHKQKNRPNQNILDFKIYLVLICLLYHSDECGIVSGCGLRLIESWTGITKTGIYRCIDQLKQAGFIRSHVHGTINNRFIKSSAPIYSLNLSHDYWQENAIYGKFYIIRYPEHHLFEVQKIESIFSVFRNAELKEQSTNDSGASYSEAHIQTFKEHWAGLNALGSKDWQLTKFYKSLQKKSQDDKNVNRLNQFIDLSANLAFLQCLLEQWCCQIYSENRDLRTYLAHANKVSIRAEDSGLVNILNQYLYPDLRLNLSGNRSRQPQLSEPDSVKLIQFLITSMNWIAFNQLYFFLRSEQLERKYTQYMQKEMQVISPKMKQAHAPFRILPRAAENTTMSCIFVLDHEAKQDQFYLIELDQFAESEYFNFIEMKSPKPIQPNIADLKKFGILDSSYQQLDGLES